MLLYVLNMFLQSYQSIKNNDLKYLVDIFAASN